jgi:Helix-turn-helix domain
VGGGGVVDWALAAGLGLIGIPHLASLLDARTPLLVADELGMRLRLGRTWVGLPWGGLHEVEHRTRHGWWRDGVLTVRTHYVQRVLEDLDPGARRVARLNRRLHGSPLAVPLGLGTRVVGASPDLTTALRALADGRTPVVQTASIEAATVLPEPADDADEFLVDPGHDVPAPRRIPDPRPALAHLIGLAAATFERPARDQALDEEVPEDEPEVVASETPAPGRETVVAARAEVRHETRAELEDVFEEDTQVWGELHGMPEVDGSLLIDDDLVQPAPDPVIGPQFAIARERLGLSVDALADRTRIRPHVIEAIEVDDFSACGGDFYARGHLRTLARVLGVEGAPLLAMYDERHADAPVDPRRVFEAELAGAGSIRATRGGPNWSVLVAAVMALVLCWSVARLVTGGPDQSPDRAALSGSGGPNHRTTVPVGKPVTVTLDARAGGARVVVRDGTGKLVFSGDLAYGQRHTLRAATPVAVQSTDGGVRVTVAGQDRGTMGTAGRPAHQSYSGR